MSVSISVSIFFSSRRLHTISKRDWSSDVCSSDLWYFGTNTCHTVKTLFHCVRLFLRVLFIRCHPNSDHPNDDCRYFRCRPAWQLLVVVIHEYHHRYRRFITRFIAVYLCTLRTSAAAIYSSGTRSAIFLLSNAPGWVTFISKIMPLSYATDALQNIMIRGYHFRDISNDFLVLIGFTIIFILLNMVVLKRQRAA